MGNTVGERGTEDCTERYGYHQVMRLYDLANTRSSERMYVNAMRSTNSGKMAGLLME